MKGEVIYHYWGSATFLRPPCVVVCEIKTLGRNFNVLMDSIFLDALASLEPTPVAGSLGR